MCVMAASWLVQIVLDAPTQDVMIKKTKLMNPVMMQVIVQQSDERYEQPEGESKTTQ